MPYYIFLKYWILFDFIEKKSIKKKLILLKVEVLKLILKYKNYLNISI
jgi:hypothetical protein